MSRPSPTHPTPDSRAALINAVWDLRDLAYDNPQPWTRVTAEDFFQSFAEVLENVNDNPDSPKDPSWTEIITALRSAANLAAAHAPDSL